MFELTADNAPDYLRERGVVGPLRVERLSGGGSKEGLGVATPQRRFVLKQSRPRLRTRDAWFSDLNRVEREWEVMRALAPVLPDVVPDVLFVDRPNYAYAMSHAPDDAVVWKAQLLAGQIDAALGERVGRVLGVMHEQSVRNAAAFAGFTDHTVYVQLRVAPFYRRIQERRPEVAAEVGRIIDGMLAAREALCHGDFSPKNLLVHAGGLTLVDYETGHLGEPAMDVGFFFSHLLLKAIRSRMGNGEWGMGIGSQPPTPTSYPILTVWMRKRVPGRRTSRRPGARVPPESLRARERPRAPRW